MTINPVFHSRTKYVKVDYHFVYEQVALGSLVTQFVSSKNQVADIFTKLLPPAQFQLQRTKWGLLSLL